MLEALVSLGLVLMVFVIVACVLDFFWPYTPSKPSASSVVVDADESKVRRLGGEAIMP